MVRESIFHEFISRNIISVQDSRLKILNNIDISSYGSNAWAWTLQTLGEKKGKEYLFNSGYLMGLDAAKECSELINKKKAFVTEKLADISNIIEITGFGLVDIKSTSKEIQVTVGFNHIIQIAKEKFGAKSMVCAFYLGAYSAFIEVFNKIKIKLGEQECICQNGKQCVYSAKLKK
jgi:predicted hydrocarbon binding protein